MMRNLKTMLKIFIVIFARKCYALPIKRQRAGKSCFLSIINKKIASVIDQVSFTKTFVMHSQLITSMFGKMPSIAPINILYVEVVRIKTLSSSI